MRAKFAVFVFLAGQLQLFFVQKTDREDGLADRHLVLNMHRDCVACQLPVQSLDIDAVVASTLPAYHTVMSAVVMSLLDDEFELDPAEAAQHLVVEFSIPHVALAPGCLQT